MAFVVEEKDTFAVFIKTVWNEHHRAAELQRSCYKHSEANAWWSWSFDVHCAADFLALALPPLTFNYRC